jgi:hypothetical protein
LGPLVQAMIGMACLLVAAVLVLRRKANPREEVALEEQPRPRWLAIVLAPFVITGRVLRAWRRVITSWIGRLNETLIRWNEIIIRWGERFDNPVLTAELRRRVRREYWLVQWTLILGVEAFFFLIFADPWYGFYQTSLAAAGPVWTSPAWGRGVLITVLMMAWVAVGFSTLGLGQSFDRERSSGTLVFLFLTPMTDTAILVGKLLPALMYSVGLLATALPWLGLGSLACALGGDVGAVITAIFGMSAVLSVLLFGAYLQLLFAVRAAKPTEGSSKALLWGLAVEFACVFLVGRTSDFTGDFSGASAALFVVTIIHLTLAYACWQLALWSLRRQRYGDVAATGKVAN